MMKPEKSPCKNLQFQADLCHPNLSRKGQAILVHLNEVPTVDIAIPYLIRTLHVEVRTNVLEPVIIPLPLARYLHNHIAEAAPQPNPVFWAEEVVTTKRAARQLIPPHGVLFLKIGLEVCQLEPAVCTAVHSVAVPDVVRACQCIGLLQGDGFLSGIGSLKSISFLLCTCWLLGFGSLIDIG